MWRTIKYEDYEKRLKKYTKKKKWDQVAAVHDNLDTVMQGLNEGLKVEQVRTFGFVHPEPHGVLAIDQKGGKGALAETRLYVYPDPKTELVHVMTLGNKASQTDDIAFCGDIVKQLKEKETGSHEREQTIR